MLTADSLALLKDVDSTCMAYLDHVLEIDGQKGPGIRASGWSVLQYTIKASQ